MFFISGSGIIDARLKPLHTQILKLFNEVDNINILLTENYHIICKDKWLERSCGTAVPGQVSKERMTESPESYRKLYEILSKCLLNNSVQKFNFVRLNNFKVVLSKAIVPNEAGSSLEPICLYMWMIFPRQSFFSVLDLYSPFINTS
eukprot:snap_masked-scaffold_22-processed-gene-4.43-mRNA-1 protein AED:1.00 eAED:1.00 QI:0/0/0/0/1/1/7/0/146